MGVDTKAILRKGVTIEQIEKAISEKYTDVEVLASRKDYMYVILNDGKNKRSMYISFKNNCEKEYGIAGVWCSLGFSKKSIEIMKYLCETFWGYIDENDCDKEWFYPINFDLYKQGTEFTKLDLLRNKVIAKLGYNNLKDAIELFKEFCYITKNDNL